MNNVQHLFSFWELPFGVLHLLVFFLFVYLHIPSLSFHHPLLLFCPVRMLTPEPLTSTDDKILVQMGAVREGETEEEKENYLAGLKEIINDMRRDKVKDFDIVAAEIAAYRRRFLRDPSRVLPL
jgi:hypothetical protein